MKKILVAPLNWGLGHATRCIPIIKALQDCNFQPIVASDGQALELLQKEFPKLKSIELPSYKIAYSKKPSILKWKLLLKTPFVYRAIQKERKIIQHLVDSEQISGIISDNRFGVRSKKVPSIYITHQLNVLSGNTTKISSKIHQQIINKYDECWIPDNEKTPNLSGVLSSSNKIIIPKKFIGNLSRFNFQEQDKKYDILVLLSGPEPQRSIFEKILLKGLIDSQEKIFFVRGKIEKNQIIETKKNVTKCNFLLSKQLEDVLNKSKLVVARSGYSTILDLANLKQKAFFVPTPNQFEQEYLAKRLQDLQIAPYCNQNDFSFELLKKVDDYKGFEMIKKPDFDSSLFSAF